VKNLNLSRQQLKEVEGIIEVYYDKFKIAWEEHRLNLGYPYFWYGRMAIGRGQGTIYVLRKFPLVQRCARWQDTERRRTALRSFLLA
jgi:hypothetical protein